ncbi:hypothetical protein BH20ACI4_BH20ACI4_18670 [soil metagenome]
MKKLLFIFIIIFTTVITISTQIKEARLFDEFGNAECEDLRTRLDSFLVELQNNPQSRGYVIVYDGMQYSYDSRKLQNPVFGEATLLTQQMIQHFKYRNFSPDRYLFINGGFRQNYEVELWIVPKYSKPPTLTPTVDEVKYRKGKLVGIVCGDT